MIRIPIIIPSLEPDQKLIQLCEELMKSGLQDIIVVDDGSGDRYRSIFDEVEQIIHTKVLVHPVNKGKGAALKTAFTELLKDEEVLGCVTADSDGQHTPKDIKRLIDAFKNNSHTLVLGVRNFNQENVPSRNRFGNKLSIYLFQIFGGVKVSDTQTGLRAIPRDFMKELLEVKENRFEFETKMLVLTGKKYPIHEVTIETVYEDEENYSTHYHPIKDSLKIFRVLIQQFFRFILSSVSSFVVDIALFALFVSLLGQRPYYAAISTILARLISAVYNYLINYHFVFNSRKNKGSSFIRYAILAGVQMMCSAAGITLLLYLFSKGNPMILKIIVDTILFFISYNIQKVIIF